eukprot:926429_1
MICDTLNGQCHLGDSLVLETTYAPSIIVNNVLYTFGGTDDNALRRKQYQYMALPTAPPTKQPTIGPTEQPSIHVAPSIFPSRDPSTTPTRKSSAPTKSPSVEPSASPFTPTLVAGGTPSRHTTETLDN